MNFLSRMQKIRAQVTRAHLHVRKIRRAQDSGSHVIYIADLTSPSPLFNKNKMT
jgi:hypothetical protein